ncbi:hypothetical protein INT47_002083 [Mucor saturninus]|uniref:NIPSNAP domain-containing protein n=1 Tax=Mucor saturninus TaxID=64648 RepID=A0A8H7R3S2_9FUNG|nr:hypothetical protein INT47_002083 [Mucor saturninus]
MLSRITRTGLRIPTAVFTKRLFHRSILSSSEKITDTTVEDAKGGRANEIIEAVLYGSKKIKEEERQTHSKVLARGKYVHELQVHKVKPDKVDEYISLLSKHLPKIANDPSNDVNLCGSWSIEIGELDTFVHIWEYKGYPGHQQTYEKLAADPDYKEFMNKLRPLLPGRLLEWEMNWRKGLECRKQFCEPVGAWFTQLGELNTVYHMWTYPDLQTRKTTREDAWNTEGWPETVYKTVRLVDNMNSFILKPLSFSPLR